MLNMPLNSNVGGLTMNRPFSRLIPLLAICAISVLLASCATQPPVTAYDPPGFFSGLLHGYFIIFGFLGGLFTDYRIYAFPNSGGWYDFGYVIGVLAFVGSAAAS